MKKISSILMVCSFVFGAINLPAQFRQIVQQKTIALGNTGLSVDKVNPFAVDPSLKSTTKLPAEVNEALLMRYDERNVLEMAKRETPYFEMVVPNTKGSEWTLMLEKVNFFHEDFVVNTSAPIDKPVELGHFYRGKIKSIEHSLVTLSIFDGALYAIISDDEANYNLGILESTLKSKEKTYILYPEYQLNHLKENYCSTPDLPEGVTLDTKEHHDSGLKAAEKCVSVYLEIDYDVFQNKGSVQNATNYLTAVFNEISVLYANEGITLQLGEILVWNSTSPYTGSTSSNTFLSRFRSNRTSYNGDVAHLVSMKDQYGGIAYVDVLCVPNFAYGWSGIRSNFQEVPTYSWTVEVITHELGHNLGSPHTQSCSWPGGAIDGCVASEGSCSRGPNPVNGGTIMSYCHLTSFGINFNNGFGELPGNLIRNEVAAANCLSTCEPDVPVCSVPSGAAADNLGQNGFDATWNEVTTAISYQFRYRATGASSWISSTVPQNNTSITGLIPDTEYEFQVRSNCDGENSAFSASTVLTTVTDQLVYCNSGGSDVRYEWIERVSIGDFTNTSGANNGYGDFTNQTINITQDEATAIQLTPGFSGQTYNEQWAIWADLNQDGDFDDAGERLFLSALSSSAVSGSITIPESAQLGETRVRVSMRYNAQPQACESYQYAEVEDYTLNIQSKVVLPCETPTNLSVLATSLTEIMIDWQAASTNETGFDVNYRAAGTSAWTAQSVSENTFTLANLNPSEAYEFRVRANCSDENSGFTGILSASTDDAPPCDAVSGLGASNISFDAARLQWNASANATSYTLEFGPVGQSLSSIQKSTVSHDLSGLDAATDYRFRVKANCQYGESNFSAFFSFRTDDAPVCQAPDGLSASALTFSSANVSWSAVANANSYVLELREVGASFQAQAAANKSVALSGLNANTNYEYRVKSICDFGESAFSSIGSFTTDEAPVNVEYCNAGANSSYYMWIQSFTVDGARYNSGNNGGYADFTATTVSLPIGNTSASFEPGYRSSLFGVRRYDVYWRVYIDLNRDGDFTDPGELVFDAGSLSRFDVNGTLNIPSSAAPGETRMRIMMKYNGAASSCENYAHGETEDLTVNLTNGFVAPSVAGFNGLSESLSSTAALEIAPNPTQNGETKLSVQFAEGVKSAQMMVMDVSGRIVARENLDADANGQVKSTLRLYDVEKGTYIVQLRFSDNATLTKRLVVQ